MRGSIERKSCRSVSRASSPIWPAISTPVGPAPTTTNVSHAARRVGVRLRLGRLERAEDAAAHDERALERLHLGGVLAPLVVAEVRVARAAGDDQRVVRERRRRRHVRRPIAACSSRASRSKSATSASSDADVAVALEDRAQRIGDLAGRQRAGRHLVGERLEEVEVAPVDERDLDRRMPKPERRLEAAEAAADDDDAVHLLLVALDHVRRRSSAASGSSPASRRARRCREQVPALVERHLHRLQPAPVVVGRVPRRLPFPQLVLLGDELFDRLMDLWVVHA